MATPTKEQLVLRALRRAGIASSATLLSPEPESMQDALIDLEDMMADWESRGLSLSYRYTSAPQPQPSEESGVPPFAVAAIANNLARILLIDISMPIPDELATQADAGYRQLLGRRIVVPMLQRRSDMPMGTGNNGRRYYHETDSLTDWNGHDIDV